MRGEFNDREPAGAQGFLQHEVTDDRGDDAARGWIAQRRALGERLVGEVAGSYVLERL